MKRLWAIADLHVGHKANLAALDDIPDHGADELIVAGDVGESEAQLHAAFDKLQPRFARLYWVPGNHELWTVDADEGRRGAAKYLRLVKLCRARGIVTPEDEYVVWDGAGGPHAIVPMALLYDYTFRPDHVAAEDALGWAREQGIVCADESYLHPAPYATREEWCTARCEATERRLEQLDPELPTVLVNHWPLRQRLAVLPRIPRFTIWCGTTRTEDWPKRFRASVAVSGHLHIPRMQVVEGTRHEEVSLGYPRQWRRELGIAAYLRQILPDPELPPGRRPVLGTRDSA